MKTITRYNSFKKFFLKAFSALLLVLLFNTSSKASHLYGGGVSYECVGPNKYVFKATFFYNCNSRGLAQMFSGLGGGFAIFNITNNCDGSSSPSPGYIDPAAFEDVTQLCAGQQSTCNGGTVPGVEKAIFYSDTITFSPTCSSYTYSGAIFARKVGATNSAIAFESNVSLSGVINTNNPTCGSSINFDTPNPIPTFCTNQPFSFSFGATSLNGYDLKYELVEAMQSPAFPMPYALGYSATQPLPGVTVLDSITGNLTNTSTTAGFYYVDIKITEYSPTGEFLGSVVREITIFIANCANQNPLGGQITNLTGTAIEISPYQLQICEGDTFSFDAVFTDADVTDTVYLRSNISTALPGATLTTSGTNPLTATITWASDSSNSFTDYLFSIQLQDSACPNPGSGAYSYKISFHEGVVASPDTTICFGQNVQLESSGGNNHSWNVISGDPIVVGANFSCNPCENPLAQPSITTTYEVVGDSSLFCIFRDTVTITVMPDFSYTLTQSDTTSCLAANVLIDIVPSPAGDYSYQWTPSSFLSSDTVANPTAMITTEGSYDYKVTINKTGSCTKKDSISITVSALGAPIFNLTTDTNTIPCSGGGAQLDIQLDTLGPPCNYELKMFDSWGGSWEGAFMDFYVNGVNVGPFTFANPGNKDSLTFSVVQGDSLKIDFTTGGYPWETSYELYDGTNTLVFSDGPSPTGGVVYTAVANCGYTPPVTVSYSWSPTAGLSDTTITNPVASPTTTTTYIATATNTANGCSNVETVLINVDGGGGIPVVTPAGPFCITGDTVTLVADIPAGVWSGTGITDTTLGIFDPTTTGGPGTYYVKYTIYGACTGSDSIPIIIDDTVSSIPTAMGPYCETNVSVPLVNTGTAGGTWSGTGVSGTNFDPSIATAGNNIVSYVVSSTNGVCTDSNVITVVVDTILPADITAQNPLCATGAAVDLTATNEGVWSGAGITNAVTGIFDPAVAGSGGSPHTITNTTTSGVCIEAKTTDIIVDPAVTSTPTAMGPYCETNASVPLVNTGTPGGTWSGTGVSGTNFDPSIATAGNNIVSYVVSSTNGVCTDSNVITVVVDTILPADITAQSPLCETGVAVNLTATNEGVWSGTGITNAVLGTFDPSVATSVGSPHTITNTTTSTNGVCIEAKTTDIIVDPAVTATITPIGPFCKDDASVPLVNTGTAGGTWSGTGVSGTNFDPTNATVGDNVVSYVVNSTNGVCTDTDVINVIVKTLFITTFAVNESCAPLCDGSVTVVPVGTPPFSVVWSDPSIVGLTETVNGLCPNLYSVTVKDNGDICVANGTATVGTPISLLVANFTYSPQPTTVANTVITLQDSSIGDPSSWVWTIYDIDSVTVLATGSGDPFTYSFPGVPGIYPVALYITRGCFDGDTTKYVIIDDVYSLYIPNAFTPNDDGINDFFFPQGGGIDTTNFSLLIYDRWGELIFEYANISTDPRIAEMKGWDGTTSKRNKVPSGVYVWKIISKPKVLSDDSSKEIITLGRVTLLR